MGLLGVTALSAGAASADAQDKIAKIQSEHRELALSDGAIETYKAISRDADLERGATMGMHQTIGLSRFLEWGREHGVSREILEKLNPTSLPLDLRPTASISLPTQVTLLDSNAEHSFADGSNAPRGAQQANSQNTAII